MNNENILREKINTMDAKVILDHLERYGDFAVGRIAVKKYGKELLLNWLREEGFTCSLEIISDDGQEIKSNVKYPPNATYILKLKDN